MQTCEIVPYNGDLLAQTPDLLAQTPDLLAQTPDLLTQIYEIECASFTDPWSAASLKDTAERTDSIFHVALAEGVPCGFGCLLVVAGEGELVDIAVSPAYRKQGIGQRLMTSLLSEAQNRHVEQIFLEVRQTNTPAQGLYRKNGFVEIGIRKRYYREPVEDAVLMQWSCPANQEEGL